MDGKRSSLMFAPVRESSQWQHAIYNVGAYVPEYSIEYMERAMWDAYKMGYMRHRAEILDIDHICQHLADVLAFATSKAQMTRGERFHMVEELLHRLETEPQFKP
jgi:regulator of RNase E activity RraB